MDLLKLKYFQTVARTEHMTKAALELHIAQPALSVMIARLEEVLGIPLFDRVGRQIRLNLFGKAFLKHVDKALGALEEGRREIEDLAGLERGSIMLATTTLIRVADILGPFISLHQMLIFALLKPLPWKIWLICSKKVKSTFCFATSAIERPGICTFPLETEEIVLAVPSTHRLSGRHSIHLSEVANDPFINLKAGYSFRKVTDEFCSKAGFIPNIVCEGDEPAAISCMVQCRSWYSILAGSLQERAAATTSDSY